jgi:hypothetical protein
MRNKLWASLFLIVSPAFAQDRPQVSEILKRLDRLEEQNRQLMEEIRSLRQLLAAATTEAAQPEPAVAPVEERVAVQERRTAELDESKVGAEHRLSVTLTGTVLFNAFRNGRYSGDQMNPVAAALAAGSSTGGGTLRQTVFGFRFGGPDIFGGGKVSGTLFLDLFGGTGASLNQLARLRTATVDLAWKSTTVTFGQDKPILAPREPDSLAQVGVSPLTAAGNLWIWRPQLRVEQRFAFGERSGLTAQAGVFQTNEGTGGVPTEYAGTVVPARPGLQGRFEWWGERDGRRVEFASGFHVSQTHVIEQSVPSRVFSVDWLLRPFTRVDFTGQFFQGENVAVVGGLQQGVSFLNYDKPRAVHATGGWAQLAFRATPRLSFHLYGGQEDDRNSDLSGDAIAKNQAYAANVMYRLGSNVVTSFEFSQVRTTYLNSGTKLNPHYDLALAYLF